MMLLCGRRVLNPDTPKSQNEHQVLAVEPQGVADMMSPAILERDFSIPVSRISDVFNLAAGLPAHTSSSRQSPLPVAALLPSGLETHPRTNIA
ncbi:hypothetical protein M2310_001558 [Rhizobium leguminosarum]|jgi:hypothetical protein|uniref:Uncharacterized protein n=1 Tax=Rhizobium esperanzae TaxID=1967781 RepID=A0A7W6UGM9_9HYPH|nr:hypothetical protein [Rhizobium esperanzae]MDH6200887.1 hypothetical protein [Rhizobium leguminosarum]OAV48187.1 hypothetical protein A6U98_31225 [Rhizobium sp. WYCCWR10014]